MHTLILAIFLQLSLFAPQQDTHTGTMVRVEKLETTELADLKAAEAKVKAAQDELDKLKATIATQHKMNHTNLSGTVYGTYTDYSYFDWYEFDNGFIVLRRRNILHPEMYVAY